MKWGGAGTKKEQLGGCDGNSGLENSRMWTRLVTAEWKQSQNLEVLKGKNRKDMLKKNQTGK